MDEAEHLADRVAVVVAGRVVALGTPDEIGGDDRHVSEVTFRLPETLTASSLPDLGTPVVTAGSDWQTRTADPAKALFRLTSWAEERSVAVSHLSVRRPSLEDVYLELIAGMGAPDERAVVS
jgi:ABC-2 type transport system ATP-binding protein